MVAGISAAASIGLLSRRRAEAVLLISLHENVQVLR
jgi:hypothetical protein